MAVIEDNDEDREAYVVEKHQYEMNSQRDCSCGILIGMMQRKEKVVDVWQHDCESQKTMGKMDNELCLNIKQIEI